MLTNKNNHFRIISNNDIIHHGIFFKLKLSGREEKLFMRMHPLIREKGNSINIILHTSKAICTTCM